MSGAWDTYDRAGANNCATVRQAPERLVRVAALLSSAFATPVSQTSVQAPLSRHMGPECHDLLKFPVEQPEML